MQVGSSLPPYEKTISYRSYSFRVKEAHKLTAQDAPTKFYNEPLKSSTKISQLTIENSSAISEVLLRENIPCDIRRLRAICEIVQSLVINAPVVVKPFDTGVRELQEVCKYLETSIVIVPHGAEKRVYVVRKGESIYKKDDTKITRAFMLTFNAENRVTSFKKIVKISLDFPFAGEIDKLAAFTLRRLAAMQQMDERPDLFPENYDYVQHKPRRVAVFQEEANGNLLEIRALKTCDYKYKLAEDILAAVLYMHQRGFVHRDLKLDNILYFLQKDKTPKVKLSDLGFACRIDDGEEQCFRPGTRLWAAPELLTTVGVPLDLVAADIWGMGQVLHAILYGKLASIGIYLKNESKQYGKLNKHRHDIQKLQHIQENQISLQNQVRSYLASSPAPPLQGVVKPDAVIFSEQKIVFDWLQHISKLLQEQLAPEFAKEKIVAQIEHRKKLIEALLSACSLMCHANLNAQQIAPPSAELVDNFAGLLVTEVPLFEKMGQAQQCIQLALVNPANKHLLAPLHTAFGKLALELSCYPFDEKKVIDEKQILESELPELEAAYKSAKKETADQIQALPDKHPFEATVEDAVQAILVKAPKNRMALQKVYNIFKAKNQEEAKRRAFPAPRHLPPPLERRDNRLCSFTSCALV